MLPKFCLSLHYFAASLRVKPFIPQNYVGLLRGPDPNVSLADDAVPHPVLQNSTLERELLILGLPVSTHFVITDVKVLDPEGKEVIKPPFLYGLAISTNNFIVVTEERYWLQLVDDRLMFLPPIVHQYLICDFQYESTLVLWEKQFLLFRMEWPLDTLTAKGVILLR